MAAVYVYTWEYNRIVDKILGLTTYGGKPHN